MTIDNVSPSTSLITSLTKRHQAVTAQILAATQAAGRRHPPMLLAVSKTHPASTVAAAICTGLNAFAENYLQEAIPKIEAVTHWFNTQYTKYHKHPSDAEPKLIWHYIGNVQSNKTRAIAEHFDWVHTVSHEKQLRRLNEQRPPHKGPLQVCLQINIDAEPQKQGISVENATTLALATLHYENLQLRGLMCLPDPDRHDLSSNITNAQGNAFERLAKLLETLRKQLKDVPTASVSHTLDTLSMGMSADLNQAIAAGSTVVRIGTALFGPRQKTSLAHY